MTKNYQDMNLEELCVYLERINEKVEEKNILLSQFDEKMKRKEDVVLLFNIIRENYREKIRDGLNKIIVDVEAYFVTKKQQKKYNIFSLFQCSNNAIFLEEYRKSIVMSLNSILKMLEDLFKNNEDVELFDSDIKKRVANFFSYEMPISMEPFYSEVLRYQIDYPRVEEMLKYVEEMKDSCSKQLESNKKELERLELEYYAIKLAILRKNQNIENVINLGDFSISRTSLKNASEFIVNMFDTEDQEMVLHRDLTNCGCSRDDGIE